MRRRDAIREFLLVLLGAVLGGVGGLVLVKMILSPEFFASFREWGASNVQQFLRDPVVFPIWLALMFGLGFYFGGRLVLWLLKTRRNHRNQGA